MKKISELSIESIMNFIITFFSVVQNAFFPLFFSLNATHNSVKSVLISTNKKKLHAHFFVQRKFCCSLKR